MDRHRPIHDGLDEHHRAERACFHRQALAAQCLDHCQVEALGVLGVRCPIEGRPSASPQVSEERELGDYQYGATNIGDRQGHASVVVGEHAQARNLVDGVLDVLGFVALGCTQVHQQAALDSANDLTIDGDARFVDSLDDGAHTELRSTGRIVLPERGNVQYSPAMKPVVGLTGGIACGKTTVAKMFGDLCIPVIDADELAREVVEPGTTGLEQIVREFGKGVLDDAGRLDRKKVGDLVFGDDEARKTLNAIMHPLIGAAGAKHIMAHQDDPAPYLLYEAALLVETGSYKAFSALIVVSAEESVQRSRLIARDGFTDAEANARIASQLPLPQKIAAADHVVVNDGHLDATRRQVAEVHGKLVEQFASKESE